MMIIRTASAGTLESSDCQVTVSPSETTELEYSGANSVIFAKRTRNLVDEVLRENNVGHAKIAIHDQGAIEITIRARLETALMRASKQECQTPAAVDSELGSAALSSWWKSVADETAKEAK